MGDHCQLLFFEKLIVLMRDEDRSDSLPNDYPSIKFYQRSTDPGAVL